VTDLTPLQLHRLAPALRLWNEAIARARAAYTPGHVQWADDCRITDCTRPAHNARAWCSDHKKTMKRRGRA